MTIWTASTTAWTFCTSGSAINKAGENADATITASGSGLAEMSSLAQGTIMRRSRKDWYTNYSTLTSWQKDTLADVSSSMIALMIANYNLNSYARLAEAQTVLNFNDNIVNQGITDLKEMGKTDIKDP